MKSRFRLTLMFLVIIMMTFSMSVLAADTPPPTRIPGDVDCSRTVDTWDAILLFRCAIGQDVQGIDPNALDADGSGEVDTWDAILVFRVAVGRTDIELVYNNPCEHSLVTDPAVAPTCTTTGLTEGKHCSVCGEVLVVQAVLDALGHTEVIDPAVAPTCTTTGLTEGKHCSVCGEVLVAQTVLDALGHTEVIDPAAAPTCTETGLTEGKRCSVCGEVLVAQAVLDALGHTEVIDPAVAPTCTETGLTEGKRCSVCGEVLVAQTVLDALGHTEVIDPAVAPTCKTTGLTEGKHCSVCGEVLVKQTVVDAIGHDFTLKQQNGVYTWQKCSRCPEISEKTTQNALVKQPMLQYLHFSDVNRQREEIQIFLPRENGYWGLNISHMVDSTTAFYDVWVHTAMQACDDTLDRRFGLTNSGAVEAAIRIDGRDDFSGGTAHGDERDIEFFIEIDGKNVAFDELTSLTCFTELKIVRRSIMYDPADHTTEIAIHNTEFLITSDGMKMSQKLTWLVEAECNYSYMAMFPVLRTTKDALGNEICISEYFYNDLEGNHYDVSESGKKEYPQRWNYGANKLTLYSNTMGLRHTMEILEISDVPGAGYSMCSNSSSYNKLYFTITGAGAGASHVAKPGDEWITVSFIDIEIGEENHCYYGHTEVLDFGVPATCTEAGLTEGKHCSVCGEVLVAQTVLDALGHTEVIDPAVTPACTTTGLTEGKHCSVCGEMLVAQTVLDALGHTEVIDPAVAPTYTTTGLTEGRHCSVCGKILVAQQEVPTFKPVAASQITSDELCDYYGITEDGTTFEAVKFGCTSYIDCTDVESITLTMIDTVTQRKWGLAFYDANKQFISFVEQGNSSAMLSSVVKSISVPENAAYFRTTYYNYEYQNSTGCEFFCVLNYKAGKAVAQYRPYQKGYIYFSREVNQSLSHETPEYKRTTGVLALPENYSSDGEPIKLIIYFHGYSHGVYMENWGSTETFRQQKQNFLDRGYAVMDCNGARDNNKKAQNTNSGAGSRQYVDGFWQCYQYVIEHYNIDPQVYVVGGSAGGPPAINFADWHGENVEALLLLSPWTDLKAQSWGQGVREPFVEYLGFENTTTYEVEKTFEVDPTLRIKTRDDGMKYIDSIKVPVKAFVGANDTVVSMHASLTHFMNALKVGQPGAELVIWEGKGHEIVSGAVFEIDTAICDWFDEIGINNQTDIK